MTKNNRTTLDQTCVDPTQWILNTEVADWPTRKNKAGLTRRRSVKRLKVHRVGLFVGSTWNTNDQFIWATPGACLQGEECYEDFSPHQEVPIKYLWNVLVIFPNKHMVHVNRSMMERNACLHGLLCPQSLMKSERNEKKLQEAGKDLCSFSSDSNGDSSRCWCRQRRLNVHSIRIYFITEYCEVNLSFPNDLIS